MRRLQAMVQSIHDIERLDNKPDMYDTDEVNMVEVIRSVAEAHRDVAAEKGLAFEVDVTTELPVVVGSYNQLIPGAG